MADLGSGVYIIRGKINSVTTRVNIGVGSGVCVLGKSSEDMV